MELIRYREKELREDISGHLGGRYVDYVNWFVLDVTFNKVIFDFDMFHVLRGFGIEGESLCSQIVLVDRSGVIEFQSEFLKESAYP